MRQRERDTERDRSVECEHKTKEIEKVHPIVGARQKTSLKSNL